MADFSGQTALVTGASGNLGAAVAQAFFKAGANVAAVDRATGILEVLFNQWVHSPRACLLAGVDVTVPQAVEKAVQEILSRFGRIDILVNTVGGYRAGKPVHETELETWDFMMNLNARSAFIASRAVIPAMLAQGRGKIVNIGSSASLKGASGAAAYAAAKSAVVRLTESMAEEYKRRGINVNAVLPGTIDTPQNRQATPGADFGLWVKPEELARVILFLASEDASPIHGALIPVFGKR
jgi:NAD(P)-dependent dehydrogenase (short-subunit alcohol dehydrogenase family)